MKKQFLLIFFSFAAAFAFAQSKQETAVLARADALTRAVFDTKDSAALLDLVSEKVTYGHSGGNLEDKSTMIHNAVTNRAVYKNFTSEPVLFRLVNKKTAVVRHILRATSVAPDGSESPLNIGVVQVWVKEGRKWRIVARQAVKVPEKVK